MNIESLIRELRFRISSEEFDQQRANALIMQFKKLEQKVTNRVQTFKHVEVVADSPNPPLAADAAAGEDGPVN